MSAFKLSGHNVVIIQMVLAILVTANDEVMSSHCIQQERKLDSAARKLIPVQTDVFKLPDERPDIQDLYVSLCPNKNFIKVSWKINASQDHSFDLCYKLKSVSNGELLAFLCFRMFVIKSYYSSSIDCWFPMKQFASSPMISVWVNSSLNRKQVFYGELNTSVLDPNNTCGDVCEITPVVISRQVTCNKEESVVYDSEVQILRMSFNATDQTLCQKESLNISSTEINRTDYILRCSHHGLGQIQVLYTVRERFCLKYQDVHVFCSETDVGDMLTVKGFQKTKPPGESFRAFVIFGVVCIVVITTAVISIIFAVQRIPAFKRKWCRKRHHISKGGIRQEQHSTINGAEALPLNFNNASASVRSPSTHSSNSHAPVDDVIQTLYVRRMDSFTSNGSASKVMKVRQLQRCATMALLENTEASYRKKILILPTPFDSYSRDATNLLRTVLTLDATIPSQCCFDREVHSQYLTGNRQTWIEQILADIDRILIFLCFTSLTTESKKDNLIVDDLLGNLLLAKPRPLCKVVFCHITDSSENLEINHHGQSFHLSHPEAYSEFLFEVLSFAGRSPEDNAETFGNIEKGVASQHFLKYVGLA